MELIRELEKYLVTDKHEKVLEIESKSHQAIEVCSNKKYSVEKLKQDEFATAFLSDAIKLKILIEEERTKNTVIAAW